MSEVKNSVNNETKVNTGDNNVTTINNNTVTTVNNNNTTIEIKTPTDDDIASNEKILALVKSLPSKKRRDIARFLDANRHKSVVSETEHLKFVAECMELLDDCDLKNSDKKLLVIYFYKDVSESNDNEFKEAFDVENAIEFIFDLSKGRFGIKMKKKGCLESFLCCKSFTVDYNGERKSLDLNMEPLQNIKKKSKLTEALE